MKRSQTYVIDARTVADHYPGIRRHVENLVSAIAPLLDPLERLVLIRRSESAGRWDRVSHEQITIVETPASPFSLSQQWVVPRLLRRQQASLYHSPYYLMPYRRTVPTLLTVHDLIPIRCPQHVSPRARLLFRFATRMALRTACHTITVSQTTRQDLLDTYPLPASAVTAIPAAADPCFSSKGTTAVERVRRKYGLPEHFVLFVGTDKPHKNLNRLLDVWSEIEAGGMLVVAGTRKRRPPHLRQSAGELNPERPVRFLERVPDADLAALYSGAVFLVSPSLYEGFGFPVLEAMACNTPVACANTPALVEVAGDAALLFEPTSTKAMADAGRRLLADEDLRHELRRRGSQRAARFSWHENARQTLQIYRRLAKPVGDQRRG